MMGSVDLLPGSQVTEASASTALMTVYAEVSLSAASGVNKAATLPLKESQSHLLTTFVISINILDQVSILSYQLEETREINTNK